MGNSFFSIMFTIDNIIVFLLLMAIVGMIFEYIKYLICSIIEAWKGPNYNREFISHLLQMYNKLDTIEKKIDKINGEIN